MESIPLRKVNEDAVIEFLQEHIMTRFGVPISLVFDNASYFSSTELTKFANEKGMKLHYSTNYYPQGIFKICALTLDLRLGFSGCVPPGEARLLLSRPLMK